MAQRKQEDDIFRKSFDAVYEGIDRAQHIDIDVDKTKRQVQRAVRTNRTAVVFSVMAIALSILSIVGVIALQAYLEHLALQKIIAPTLAERLTAPYNLETTFPPYLLNAVTVEGEVEDNMDFQSLNISYLRQQPPAESLLAEVAQIQSIMPSQIADFTLLWDRTQDHLLSSCLVQSASANPQTCTLPHIPEYMEAANYIDSNGETVSLVLTKFASDLESNAVFDLTYRFARRIGRIGNFSFIDELVVDYFYSRTRNAISFTWINENWVMTVSSTDIDSMEAFMEVFPLYENNPNLDQFVVEQVARDSGLYKLEPTPAPTLDPASAISGTDAISGTTTIEEIDAVSGTESD